MPHWSLCNHRPRRCLQVVCRQLGFAGGVHKLFRQSPQTGPVLAGRLRCNGSEPDVGRCAFQFWSEGEAGHCNPGEEWEDMDPPYEVGVVCSGGAGSRGGVRGCGWWPL